MAKPELKKAYCEFMAEYERSGHMEKVEETYLVNKSNSYCLPHHGVIKKSSTTTKLRTVFNGSFRTNSGYSLYEMILL